LLRLDGVSVALGSPGDDVVIVDAITFDVRKGEAVALVGESGCGKTMTARAVLGLLPATGRVTHGTIDFGGRDLASLSDREMRKVRGKQIALVSQEPMVSLNPAFRVGWQLEELIRKHQGLSRRAARAEAVRLLGQVRIPSPEVVVRRYPHELSGGMAQRVSIARALIGDPDLLIADEPTTALDVTVQAEILDLLRELQADRGMSILLVTHDWGVVADMADRAVVMYAGEVVERSAVTPLFRAPLHPYAQGLLASDPHRSSGLERLPSIPGTVPKPGDWPTGCHFRQRCDLAMPACASAPVPLFQIGEDRQARCLLLDHATTESS
jgi:peptide/nickel transport system permease protein